MTSSKTHSSPRLFCVCIPIKHSSSGGGGGGQERERVNPPVSHCVPHHQSSSWFRVGVYYKRRLIIASSSALSISLSSIHKRLCKSRRPTIRPSRPPKSNQRRGPLWLKPWYRSRPSPVHPAWNKPYGAQQTYYSRRTATSSCTTTNIFVFFLLLAVAADVRDPVTARFHPGSVRSLLLLLLYCVSSTLFIDEALVGWKNGADINIMAVEGGGNCTPRDKKMKFKANSPVASPPLFLLLQVNKQKRL